MRISWNWLNELADLGGIDPREAGEKLTDAGVECDGVYRLAEASGLVIGRITACEKMEGSDHLHVLEVDEGPKYGLAQIVCGAPNARVGLKVIVARPGASLPGGKIEAGKIRGVVSSGMCCSLLEIGVDRKFLSDKQIGGIEELPGDAPLGEEDVLKYLGLDDYVLELEVLPSRPDILSALGIARELCAIYSRKMKYGEPRYSGSFDTVFSPASETEDCPRFSLIEARGISNRPSPKWLKERLIASDIRPIDAVVDIGNYAMLLTGRPLNMYDAGKMKGKVLSARKAAPSVFRAMDGNDYALKEGDIAIYDGDSVACLAGIMTSDEYRVKDDTEDVLVECAEFFGPCVRRTSARLGLTSDSSSRFAHGVNPEADTETLAVVSGLLRSICGAKEVSNIRVYGGKDFPKKEIPFTTAYINKRLGTALSDGEIVSILTRDHLFIEGKDGSYVAKIPSYRLDLLEQCDLSEEVIRLLGYDAIASHVPEAPISLGGLTPHQEKRRGIRKLLSSRGLYECLTYTLVPREEKDAFAYLSAGGECYELANPLTPERAFVRKSVLPSLLAAAGYNVSRQNGDFCLYEVSDVDYVGYKGERLAVVGVGHEHLEGEMSLRPYGFYYAKGLFEAVLAELGLVPSRFKAERLSLEEAGEEYHPYRSVKVKLGRQVVAVFGELHPKAAGKYGLRAPCFGFEADLGTLIDTPAGNKKAAIPPRFPKVRRDLSLLVDRDVEAGKLLEAVRRSSSLVKEAFVFDVYEGKGLPEGKKSLAIGMWLYLPERTLVDSEIEEAMKKAVGALGREGAEVRS